MGWRHPRLQFHQALASLAYGGKQGICVVYKRHTESSKQFYISQRFIYQPQLTPKYQILDASLSNMNFLSHARTLMPLRAQNINITPPTFLDMKPQALKLFANQLLCADLLDLSVF